MFTNFDGLIKEAQSQPARTVSVAVAQDKAVLEAVKNATDLGFVKPVLVGDAAKIEEITAAIGFKDYAVVDAKDEAEAVEQAVRLVHDKKSGRSHERSCQYGGIYARRFKQRIRSQKRAASQLACGI